jgi:hypothetical protein
VAVVIGAVVVGGGGADIGGVGGDGVLAKILVQAEWCRSSSFSWVENCSRVGDVVEETCCLCH